MAVGDAVNFYSHATATFQPASGVEIMVLTIFTYSHSNYFGITNGTDIASNYSGINYTNNTTSSKYVITNTDYYYHNSPTHESGFSGIQIK